MTPLEWVGVIALGLVALAVLYFLAWGALAGINNYVMTQLRRAGVVYHDYSRGWKATVKDVTDWRQNDREYRPSKDEVRSMIDVALAEAAAAKKGGKK